MNRQTEAHHALRSLLPERYLIRHRDVKALSYKYEARLTGTWEERWETWSDRTSWEETEPDTDLDYAKQKDFDGMYIEGRTGSPASAIDPETGARIRLDKKDATLIHVTALHGVHHFRSQLAGVAEYIKANKPLRRTELVAGVTYREMGRFAMALGFREMKVASVDPEYETTIHSMHMAFCAVNGREAEFEPAAIYLPTDEFVRTFQA
jgi:hypothetical protein